MSGRRRTSIPKAAELCAWILKGEPFRKIQEITGISLNTIKAAYRVLEASGVTQPRRPDGRARDEMRSKIQELLQSTDLSSRAIAARIGCSVATVCRVRAAHIAEALRYGEALPKCECGEYLHHPRSCWARAKVQGRGKGYPVSQLTEDQRQEVSERLLAGEFTASIAQRFGLKKMAIKGLVQRLSDDERAERSRHLRAPAAQKRALQAKKDVKRPLATNPRADPLYARIMDAIPKGIDRSLAEDAAGDAYLACLEGQREAKLEATVKRELGRNFNRFANPWGTVSLDARQKPDEPNTLLELVEDPRALAAFEQI